MPTQRIGEVTIAVDTTAFPPRLTFAWPGGGVLLHPATAADARAAYAVASARLHQLLHDGVGSSAIMQTARGLMRVFSQEMNPPNPQANLPTELP